MLEKIETLLLFAFQSGDGPFEVVVRHEDNTIQTGSFTKQEILELSLDENFSPKIVSIELTHRLGDRRWRTRVTR